MTIIGDANIVSRSRIIVQQKVAWVCKVFVTIGVNLVNNVSVFDTPFAPLGLAISWINARTIHLSPLWGLLLVGSIRTIHFSPL